MPRLLALLLLLVAAPRGLLGVEVEEQAHSSANEPVDILRCCGADEQLHQNPSTGLPECGPGSELHRDSSEASRLIVYSPTAGNFLSEWPSSWRLRPNSRPTCGPRSEQRLLVFSVLSPFVLFESGLLELEPDGSGKKLGPQDYCIGGASSVLACVPTPGPSGSHRTQPSDPREEDGQPTAGPGGKRPHALTAPSSSSPRPRLRKCCGPSAAYDRSSCVSNEDGPAMSLEEEKALLLATSGGSVGGDKNSGTGSMARMEIVTGFPRCPRQHQPSDVPVALLLRDDITIIGDMGGARLQTDASLLLNGLHIPPEEFCIERLRHEAGRLLPAKVFACSSHADKGSSFGHREQDIRFILYPAGFIVSAIFLAATLATGCLLPASHHVLHWRCQTHHVACLMLGDVAMAIIQLAGQSLHERELCRILAIFAHFFFLATFFWLNTMCFNIWWTFRDLRPASLEKGQEVIRLRFYAAYAWGGPLIIAGLAAFMDSLPHSDGDGFIRPHFGENKCWFGGKTEIFAYFFGPIGILLAVNLIFFAATARELTCGLWRGEFVKSTTERAALGKVCLKLVVVMGVPWIFDVISWLVGGPDSLWFVTDLLNAAQGILIFVVVGCQPQVRAALKRLWSRNPRTGQGRQGNGLSTTSHGMPSIGDSTITQNNPSTKSAPLETIC